MLSVAPNLPPTVYDEFERVWPWLEASLEFAAFKHNGKVWMTHHKSDVWARITTGKSFLWPGDNCALLTEIHESPTGLRSHHIWLAGGDLKEIVSLMPAIEAWARSQGCHRQTGAGRRGWLRAFQGYEEIGCRKAKSLL